MNRAPLDARIRALARRYNHPRYFEKDPVIFPRHFAALLKKGQARLQDVEIAAVIAAHLAWGRREMIIRDITRALDQMQWQPFRYVMNGAYRSDSASLHRTVTWAEFSGICSRLNRFYRESSSLEVLSPGEMRVRIFGRKENPRAADKKIHLLRRWMVRNDGLVDLGLWTDTRPGELIIPLDVHVHRSALEAGITRRKSHDLTTALEITEFMKGIFPDDPCLGDFALFARAALPRREREQAGSGIQPVQPF